MSPSALVVIRCSLAIFGIATTVLIAVVWRIDWQLHALAREVDDRIKALEAKERHRTDKAEVAAILGRPEPTPGNPR